MVYPPLFSKKQNKMYKQELCLYPKGVPKFTEEKTKTMYFFMLKKSLSIFSWVNSDIIMIT